MTIFLEGFNIKLLVGIPKKGMITGELQCQKQILNTRKRFEDLQLKL